MGNNVQCVTMKAVDLKYNISVNVLYIFQSNRKRNVKIQYKINGDREEISTNHRRLFCSENVDLDLKLISFLSSRGSMSENSPYIDIPLNRHNDYIGLLRLLTNGVFIEEPTCHV